MSTINLRHEKRTELDKAIFESDSINDAIEELNYLEELWKNHQDSVIHRSTDVLIVKDRAFNEKLTYIIN